MPMGFNWCAIFDDKLYFKIQKFVNLKMPHLKCYKTLFSFKSIKFEEFEDLFLFNLIIVIEIY